MKKVIVFATKARMFLCLIPFVFLFAVCLINNENITTPGKLYPLMIAMLVGAVMTFLYFFRAVTFTVESVRTVGPFSSKDSAVIKKDRTLSFTLRPKNKLKIELFGRDDTPGFDWLKETEEGAFAEVNLYRDIAVGSDKAVGRVLGLFGLDEATVSEILLAKSFDREFPDFSVKKYDTDLGMRYDVRFYTTF